MSQITFPYTMHCTYCKAKIKIKSAKMIGQKINCPKCAKPLIVVTPDEDGNIPYGVEAHPEPEPEPEPTEEELEAKRLEKLKAKRKVQMAKAKYAGGTLWYVVMLAAMAGGVYYLVTVKGFGKRGALTDAIDSNVPTE